MSRTNQSKSFAPEKCLLYKDNFDGIIDGKLRPPIELSLDPSNACNFDCVWCNASKAKKNKMMTNDELFGVIKDVAEWGVRGVCYAGGGESSVHPKLAESIELCSRLGLESSIISNGYAWSDKLIDTAVKNMRWIGISVDAANAETFKKAKGIDGFNKVIENLKKMVEMKNKISSNVGITYKFLIHSLNQHEIYDACKLAKEIGCGAIHIRPTDFLSYKDIEESLDVDNINNQIEKAKKLASDEFEVVATFFNFKKNLKRKINFNECLLSPLLGLCMPDGWWVCVDRRGHNGLRLCDIDKIREFWGSKEHLEILKKINPKSECGKCTMSKYYPYFYGYKYDEYFWKFA